MTVTVNDDCVGCALCVDTCPDVFELDDGEATVKVDVVPGNLEQIVRDAADECPVEAIDIHD